MIGIDDLLAVGLEAGDRANDRSSGDDDVLRVDRLFLAIGEGDFDLSFSGDLTEAVKYSDLVLFHQIGHAGGILVDYSAFVLLNARPIVAEVLDR